MQWESISVRLHTRGIALSLSGDWLRTGRLGFESRKGQYISLRSIQTGSEAHTDSYPMGIGGFFPAVKRAEREDDLQSSTEVKNGGAIPSLPHTPALHSFTSFVSLLQVKLSLCLTN
jgi:hypothetical protein